LNFCSSHQTYYFNIKSDIQYAEIDGLTTFNEDILDFKKRNVMASQRIDVSLSFYRSDLTPYANMPINVNTIPVQVPPSFFYAYSNSRRYSEVTETNFFEISLYNTRTDSAGKVRVILRLRGKFFGRWAIAFSAGGAITLPYSFQVFLGVKRLEIAQEPKYIPKSGQPTIIGTGDVFTQVPKIKVVGSDESLVSGVIVVALFEEKFSCVNGSASVMFDSYSYGCNPIMTFSPFVTTRKFYGKRYAISNEKGIAEFDTFSVSDSISNACTSFVFAVGEPDFLVRAPPSEITCMQNYNTYTLYPGYSISVTDGQPFGKPPVVQMKRAKAEYNPYAVTAISAMVRFVDGTRKDQKRAASSQVLESETCMFFGKQSLDGNCDDLKIVKKKNPLIFEVTFSKLTWTKPTVSSNFILEFGPQLLNDNLPLSALIDVVSSPNNLLVFLIPNNQ